MIPISSCNSRESACAGDSPTSTFPPGNSHQPAHGLPTGLWLSFYAFGQAEYLAIAAYWLQTYGVDFDEAAKKAALQFTYTRGARSGRVAYHFARDYAGQLKLNDQNRP